MEKIDIAIIGGGVIGLAVASAVAGDDKDVFIIEKNMSFGEETSSRNSEVIHSGIYYPKSSLKALTCLEGNRLLYEICRTHGIPHSRTGKLIVARDASEIEPLEDLFKRGEFKTLTNCFFSPTPHRTIDVLIFDDSEKFCLFSTYIYITKFIGLFNTSPYMPVKWSIFIAIQSL